MAENCFETCPVIQASLRMRNCYGTTSVPLTPEFAADALGPQEMWDEHLASDIERSEYCNGTQYVHGIVPKGFFIWRDLVEVDDLPHCPIFEES